MALSIGSRSRSILNGTQTVPALAPDPRITFGLKLGDSSVVCHAALKRDHDVKIIP